jgi:hypothetical protein
MPRMFNEDKDVMANYIRCMELLILPLIMIMKMWQIIRS